MKELRKNNERIVFIVTLFITTIPQTLVPQIPEQHLGIMFYNVENLFDTRNDSLKNDEEFLPIGNKHWNYNRYNQKLKNISRVIYESGGWEMPVLIGLCEIENKKVINDLIWKTGLNNQDYHSIHFESPDKRGIDVALLYRNKIFTPIESVPINVNLGKNSRPTRDILYVFGLLKDTIPLHVFIVHFPSRYGGVMESKSKRITAAKTLNDTIRNIFNLNPNANMIIMGDFNDNPEDESIQKLVSNTALKNLSQTPETINKSQGTLKYKFEWDTFDQFFISKNLLDSNATIHTKSDCKILDFKFLLEKDKAYTGYKPFRTYIGYKYNNGFSDHLPIWITLVL